MSRLLSHTRVTIQISGLTETGLGYTEFYTGWIEIPVVKDSETAIEAGRIIQEEADKLLKEIERLNLK